MSDGVEQRCDFLNAADKRLLLHTEASDGSVIPVWEEVHPEDVAVLKDVMAQRNVPGNDVELVYKRVPITAERALDFADLSELIEVVVRYESSNTPIVVNCQLGRGRSTMTSVRSDSDSPPSVKRFFLKMVIKGHLVVGATMVGRVEIEDAGRSVPGAVDGHEPAALFVEAGADETTLLSNHQQ
jgi:hypothetical protein